MNDPLRIVIVDDHGLFGQGLALLLSTEAGDRFEVAGRTTRVEEAATLAADCRADVAIVDLAMPPLGGSAAIRQIRTRSPDTRILALSGTDDLELAEEAVRAGAHGYLPKSADPEVLVAPLLALADGFGVFDERLVHTLVDASRKPPQDLVDRLSRQEIHLWKLVAGGLETTELARRMFVSDRSAKRMVAGLLNKIGAANRIEAAGLAGQFGLLEQESSPQIR
ncbi:response regulator transcription factor [Haloechinothrix aidingensis]|uniref:response regulator transcription factor n=1 Tax=Haloechinothrix aidingensis TaxID=2752311 RepID=UPI0031B595F4